MTKQETTYQQTALRMINSQPDRVRLATSDHRVSAYVDHLTDLVPYRRQVYAAHAGQLVPLPLGLEAVETCYGGPLTPEEARRLIEADARPYRAGPRTTVEQAALASVGPRLYEVYVRGYVAKQWGAAPSCLSAEVFTDRFTIPPRPDRQRSRPAAVQPRVRRHLTRRQLVRSHSRRLAAP